MTVVLSSLDGERVGGQQIRPIFEALLTQIDSTGQQGAWVNFSSSSTFTPSGSGTHTSVTKNLVKYRKDFDWVDYVIDYQWTQSTANSFAVSINLPFTASGTNFAFAIYTQNITDSTLDADVLAHIHLTTSLQVYNNSQFINGKAYRIKVTGGYIPA